MSELSKVVAGTCRVVLRPTLSGGLRSAPLPRSGTGWWIYDVMLAEAEAFSCGFDLANASAPLAPGGPEVTIPFKLGLPSMRARVVLGQPMRLFRDIGTVVFVAWAGSRDRER